MKIYIYKKCKKLCFGKLYIHPQKKKKIEKEKKKLNINKLV